MRVLTKTILIGCLPALGTAAIALFYPGANPFIPTPQNRAEDLIREVLTTATTTPARQAYNASSTDSDGSPDKNSTDATTGMSDTARTKEVLTALFDAIARADKETYPAINDLDYERIYDPTMFADRTELTETLATVQKALSETRTNIETYIALRERYVSDVFDLYDAPEDIRTKALERLHKNFALIRPHSESFSSALGVHLDHLASLYTLMLDSYGTYEVADDGDGAYVFFDDDDLQMEYDARVSLVAESGALVDEATERYLAAADTALKAQEFDMSARELLESMKKKYY